MELIDRNIDQPENTGKAAIVTSRVKRMKVTAAQGALRGITDDPR